MTHDSSTFRADLHCHTTCSDGSLTPVEILHLAKKSGLSALSITDHDTVAAYDETTFECARSLGLLLGTGVEFSTEFKGKSVHLLGYGIDVKSGVLQGLCERHRERRENRNIQILERLKKLKMPIDLLELKGRGQTIGRPHIAQLMLEKGYVDSLREAFQIYLADEKLVGCRGEGISIEETMSVIHEAGGKSFLAHPHLMKNQSLIKDLLKLPFDGIECYYGKLLGNQEKRWLDLAKRKELLVSGGSDFHGSAKPYLDLGSSWVDDVCFFQIFKNLGS